MYKISDFVLIPEPIVHLTSICNIPSGIMKFEGVESVMLAIDVTYGDRRWAVEDCSATQSTVSQRSQ